MKKTVWSLVVLLAPLFVTSVFAANDETPIIIMLSARSVTATGIKPGGEAAVLAIARYRTDTGVQVRHWRNVVRDDDGDGAVSVALTRDLSSNSVWAFVDIDSGRTAIATPDGSRFVAVPFPAGVLKKNGNLDRYQSGREWVDALLVRPKVGVWGFAGGDGGAADDDLEADGRLTFNTEKMQKLAGNAPAPSKFNHRDVFILIDPQRMEYSSTEVEP
ncbi:MAG TPA: hypothetical protein VN181_14190 [Thermoanaerobaculia bacterium]|nr:hypothetical protein [Thermoanaerobaculia bacterium]